MRQFIALVCVISMPLVCRAQALADRVPSDAILYVGWRGALDPGAGYASSRLKSVVDQSEFPSLIHDKLPAFMDRLSLFNPTLAQIVQTVSALGRPLWLHPTAFYVGGLDLTDPQHPIPHIALLCDAADDGLQMVQSANALIENFAKNLPFQISVKSFGTLVVISTFDWTDPPSQPLVTDDLFKATLAQVGSDPTATLYLDVEKLLAQVDGVVAASKDAQAADLWPKIRDALGIAGLKRVAATDGFVNGDFCSECFVSAPAPRVGLVALLDDRPLSDDLLKTIPVTSTRAIAGRFDVSRLVAQVRRGIAIFSPGGGDQFDGFVQQGGAFVGVDLQKDIIDALGSEWAAYSDPTVGGYGGLGGVLVNRAQQPELLEGALARLEQFANATVGGVLRFAAPMLTVEFRNETIDGLHIHYAAIPLFTPAWTFSNGYCYLSLYPQVTYAAAKMSAASQSGASQSLLDNADYQNLRSRLGGPANVTGVIFVDTPKLAPIAYPNILLLSRVVLGAGDVFGLESPAMVVPPLFKIMPELEAVGGITWVDDAGFHSKALQAFPGDELLATDTGMVTGLLQSASSLAPMLSKSHHW